MTDDFKWCKTDINENMYSSFGFEHDTEMYMRQSWVWFYIFTILLHCNVVTAMEKKNIKEHKLIFPNVCRFCFPWMWGFFCFFYSESQHKASHFSVNFISSESDMKPQESLDSPDRICIVFPHLQTRNLKTVTLRMKHKHSAKMKLTRSIQNTTYTKIW